MIRRMFAALGLGFVLALSGCGGGGGDDVVGSPAGLYEGTTADNRAVTGLVLETGNYYVLYTAAGNPSLVRGFITGSGASNNGAFASNDAIDFNFEEGDELTGTLFASYWPQQSFNASITYTLGGTNSLTSTYNADWEDIPSLNTLSGNYTGQMGNTTGIDGMVITISNMGVVSGTVDGTCAFSGSAETLSTGNAYSITFTFTGGTCQYNGQTMSGVAYFDAGTNTLISMVTNPSRSDGFLFIGDKT